MSMSQEEINVGLFDRVKEIERKLTELNNKYIKDVKTLNYRLIERREAQEIYNAKEREKLRESLSRERQLREALEDLHKTVPFRCQQPPHEPCIICKTLTLPPPPVVLQSEHDKVIKELDSGEWYQAGLSIATLLVEHGCKSCGVVDGVKEIITKLTAYRDIAERLADAIKYALGYSLSVGEFPESTKRCSSALADYETLKK